MFLINALGPVFKFSSAPFFPTNVKYLIGSAFHYKHYSTIHLKTHYSILGIKPEASDKEIKEAYYKLSKKYHPDLNIGDKVAQSKMLEVNEAFEVIGNKAEKKKYDDKMFPKVWEKNSFIYNQETSEPQNFIYQRTFKSMSHGYDQFIKHRKGQLKRKHRHTTQKYFFNKSKSSVSIAKTYFKS